MENPISEHLKELKRVVRQIKETLDLGIIYEKAAAEKGLIGYNNIDLVGDLEDKKSTFGMIFFFGSCLISWSSQKQMTIALSSRKAKYIVASAAAGQGI